MKKWRLFFLINVFAIAGFIPVNSFAHQSPNTLIFLDASPGRIKMEIQLPLPELELAFGNDIAKSPETLIEKFSKKLDEYLKAHIHAYATREKPWTIEIISLTMDKGKYIESGLPYWEVIADIILKPQPGENTRKFMLDYDVIMHQVVNHVALVSIRSDWESGNLNSNSAEARAIGWNTRDNVIYALEINLEKGSWWKGFKSMLSLGLQHIKEGTDHLLFLLVLLLPAMLLINGKQWGEFGGINYSLARLLKIVTAFTVGHSITLLIGALGWLKLPTQPVEILIAFSILISAVHAVYPIFPRKEIYVAAGFGLVHGLAFATILSNLQTGAGTLVLSILGFNLGIEIMQLFIIAMIVPWLILLGKTSFYKWFRITGAALAAIAAVAWIVERSSGKTNFITELLSKSAEHGWWYMLSIALISITVYYWHSNSYKRKQPFTVIKEND